jgi:hypothetical protein
MANYPDFVPYPFQAERHPARHPICTDGLEDHRHRVVMRLAMNRFEDTQAAKAWIDAAAADVSPEVGR